MGFGVVWVCFISGFVVCFHGVLRLVWGCCNADFGFLGVWLSAFRLGFVVLGFLLAVWVLFTWRVAIAVGLHNTDFGWFWVFGFLSV